MAYVWLLKIILIALTLTSFSRLVRSALKADAAPLIHKYKTFFAGLIANIADSFGLGSFTVIIALNNNFKFLDERKIVGTLNCQSLLSALTQALIFLQFIEIDIITLICLVSGTSVGAFFSSSMVSSLPRQKVRLGMAIAFSFTAFLVLISQLKLLPLAGDAISLRGGKLLLACFGMALIACLPSFGVGMYAPLQVFMFFLGMAPLVAFPVMSFASGFQQSIASANLLRKNEVQTRSAVLLAIAGFIGVLFAAPLVTSVDKTVLRWLLFVMICYNALTTWRIYFKNRIPAEKEHKLPEAVFEA